MNIKFFARHRTFNFFLALAVSAFFLTNFSLGFCIESLSKQTSQDFTQIAKTAIPAVVAIKVQTNASPKMTQYPRQDSQELDPFDFFQDDFWNRFFGLPPGNDPRYHQKQPRIGQGSGFVVSEDGYILTNAHVVKDADMITVSFNDGKEYQAKLIGLDASTDIALVKIEAKQLPFLKLGDSDNLEIGQWVIAIGNPLGFQASLTVGVVSAKGRNDLKLAKIENFIQTDAAINRGNSGGPLLNLDGKVVGINTAIASNTGGYVGIGFAIPSCMVEPIMNQLIATGSVAHGFIGVNIQKMDQELAKAFGLDRIEGALIADIIKDSPAEKAGLQRGDIIVKLNQKPIESVPALVNAISFMAPGTKANLTINRNSKIMEIPIVVGTSPEDTPPVAAKKAGFLGIEVQNLTPDLAQQLGYLEDKGVVIKRVDPGSLAAMAGLRRGDLILSINRKTVSNTEEFSRIASEALKSKDILFLIKQDGYSKFLALKVE